MSAPIAKGQVWRTGDADVRIEEVDPDGPRVRVILRRDGHYPWRQWMPLPLPPDAVLVSTVHWDDCWTVHDECALHRALAALEANLADALPVEPVESVKRCDLFRVAIRDHADKVCAGECYAVDRAREILQGEWP